MLYSLAQSISDPKIYLTNTSQAIVTSVQSLQCAHLTTKIYYTV